MAADAYKMSPAKRAISDKFRKWLWAKYCEWADPLGDENDWADFADYLGVSPKNLNKWKNGLRVPGGDHAIQIANKLGRETYKILGLPDPK